MEALEKVNENPYLKRMIVRELHFHEKWKKYEKSQKWTFWSPCFPEYSFLSIWRSDAPETIAHKAFGEHEAQGAPQTIAHKAFGAHRVRARIGPVEIWDRFWHDFVILPLQF